MKLHQAIATPMTRRRLLVTGSTAMLAGFAARSLPALARAQGKTDDTMGYPAITVTVSDRAIEGPESFPAGLTHVTVKNTQKDGLEHMVWGKLPDGTSTDDVLKLMAESESAPPAEDPTVKLLEQMTIVGGPDEAAPGRDAIGIIPFTEGQYILINIFGEQPPFFFEVTAPDPKTKTEEPTAELTVQLGNMVFLGLDNGVPAGKHLWKIENIDKTFHELALIPIDAKWTEEDLLTFMKTASDEEGMALFTKLKGASSIQTPGITSWHVFDLPPGHYAAACFAPTSFSDENAMPHAMMGMVKVFDAKKQ